MLKYFAIFFALFVLVKSQTINWGSRACIVNRNAYYTGIMQEAITKIERELGWSNFKLEDLNFDINLALFKWQVRGYANYTNGFVVSMRSMDINNILSSFSSRTVDGVPVNEVNVRGSLNLRNLTIGYDVSANLEDTGTHRFTGVYMFSLVTFQCAAIKNLDTNEASATAAITSSTGARRMEYLPHDSVSEVLSRDFLPRLLWDSFVNWATDIFVPYIREAALHAELPEIRYDYSC